MIEGKTAQENGEADGRSSSSGILSAHQAGKVYTTRSGEPVVALEEVSFDVSAGRFITLVGPSGCGKSTLLNLMGGLLTPSSGEIRYRGEQIRGPRYEIGMMFQSPVLFPWRTTLENVLLPADLRRQKRSDYREKALGLLEMVGLQDFAEKYPKELSGGMQQRAALARLLLEDPDVMLLDEPFGALDEFTRETMNLELLDVWSDSGKTAVLVTHNIAEALFLADQVYVMSARPGRVVKIIDVDLPRPRDVSMMRETAFQELVAEARLALGLK